MRDYSDKIYDLNIFSYKKNINYNLFNVIKNYIKTGYLDDNKVRDSYYEQIQSLERDKFWIYYKKLLNENHYKSNEIKEALKVVFDKIKECLNNSNEKVETKYITEYIRDFNNLKKYIDLYDENTYRKEIKEYIELTKKINDNHFDNLDLNLDKFINQVVFEYNCYIYENKKTYKYKNSRMYEIDKYYEDKLNGAYKKARENIENRLIKIFENKEMDNYISFNYSSNGFIVFYLVMNSNFLEKLEVNAYNIDIIIKFIDNNILYEGDSFDFDKVYNPLLKGAKKYLDEVKKYLNDDKIKNGNYDDNTNKKIEELKSVIVKAEEHINKNK